LVIGISSVLGPVEEYTKPKFSGAAADKVRGWTARGYVAETEYPSCCAVMGKEGTAEMEGVPVKTPEEDRVQPAGRAAELQDEGWGLVPLKKWESVGDRLVV